MDGSRHHDPRREAASAYIAQLRAWLLDVSARNPLLSFSHARQSGGRVNVRAVHGHLNTIHDHLADGKALPVRPLPAPEEEPADEKTSEFLAALEAARGTDTEYQAALESLAADELASSRAAQIERGLRDRVREALGLPPWKAVNLTGLADYAQRFGIDPSFDLAPTPAKEQRAAKGGTAEFQTLVLPEQLERHLAKLRDTARTVVEETGVSTLHLALGFLEWFESDSSDKALTSPLLLLRVDLDRKIVRSHYHYFVVGGGEDAEANATLSERLNRDFRIQLPSLGEDETPEAYLVRVEDEVCKGRSRWRVRRFATLAHFPFARLAMYHDLDEAQWARSGGLSTHPVLAELLGGSESDASMFAEEHDVDTPEVEVKVPLLVLEADASQHSAVYDVMSGRNLVIEGPPGTGKSQTITNVIAAALASGKRVLFMADKQAALQVVKDRLDKVGLGDFCLELHSGKARKKDVLDALQQRLNRKPTVQHRDKLDGKLRELGSTRSALTRYAEILNARLGAFGATVHDILWADRRRREGEGEEARRLDALSLPACERLTGSDIERRTAVLDRFERAAQPILAEFGRPAHHPWFGVTRSDLPAIDFAQATRGAADCALTMVGVQQAADRLAGLGVEPNQTLGTIQDVANAIARLPASTAVPANWYRGLCANAARQAASAWLEACEAYQRALADLRQSGIDSDGADGAEAAAALESLLGALANVAPAGLAVASLADWSAELRAEAGRIHEHVRTAEQAARLLGIFAPSTIGDLTTVLRAIDLVQDASDQVIATINPEITAKDSRDVLLAASRAIAELRVQAEALAADFSIAKAAKPEELRRHAATLREAGLFSFLSSAAKAAVRCHVELRKTSVKAGKREMADALLRIAEHLEAVAALEARQDYRAAFGNRFRGLATYTKAVVAAADWAARVRAGLAGVDDTALAARRALLAGDGERLEVLAALAKQPGCIALRECVARFPEPSMSLESIAFRLEGKAAAAEALAAECRRRRIPGAARIAGLPELCRLLRAAHAAAEAASIPSSIAAALGASAPRPLNDLAPMRAALTLATAVAELPVSESGRQVLQGMDPREIQAVVVPGAGVIAEACERATAGWRDLQSLVGLDEAAFLGGPLADASPAAVAERLQRAAGYPGGIGGWVAYLIERDAALELDLGGLVALWDEEAVKGPLAAAFDRVLHHSLARAAFTRHPELNKFTGLGQDGIRAQFKALDRETAELRRGTLGSDLTNRPVPMGVGVGRKSEYTDRALILSEIAKQKRHIPIRQLLDRAGAAIQALKPCFMMSPLSVAQYLKPNGLRFDLLVVDEASQMRPEDALGAIARSGQIVVVGDPKQLPPTAFFSRLDGAADDETEDEQVDAESILDMALAVFRPARRLRWHYRSRHGSLVAFSNREFYDDDLIVFPSPREADPTQGVTSTKVEGIYKNRSNVAEVEAVCQAAAEHMRRYPERSLGIATLNQVQRDLIAEEMDRLTTSDPEVQAYRERWSETLERFFVKNLENVQGDERDVIFVSTVFGPPEPGGKVKQTFGPINGKAGHRRLNVLFTRAKHHVRVFTSMTPDDITAGPDSPRGARVLRDYLAYAATGRLEGGMETGREADSDFEVFVRDRLRLAGYEAVPQVGVAGYFIDLAVRDPDVPGTFLLGIECDGASYHSSRSARDRDILRQQVLEGLGWTIYRIWSTDWFRDPVGQTRKMVSFIEETRKRRPPSGLCRAEADVAAQVPLAG